MTSILGNLESSGTWDRRSFLAGTLGFSAVTAALAAVTGPGAGCAVTGSASRNAGLIDTHTHFYDPRRPGGVPWPPADDPVLYRPVLPEEYRQLVRPVGVAGTVVVEASPWESDNEWLLELAARDPFLLGIVGHLKPGRAPFAEQLARYAANPKFRGIRTGLWEVSVTPEMAEFRESLRLLAARDLTLDVLVGPDRLGLVAQLAEAVPDLRIVIDHCANVRVDGAAPPAAWREGLQACARHPQVFMKVSGLVEGTGRTDGTAPGDVAYYTPVLAAVWEAFGEDRVVFGSNWPVSARFASYATVHRIVSDYATGLGVVPARKYFRENAVRAYRLPGSGPT